MLNELALFAGAGGGILGGQLLGWRTRCAVEIDPYCRSILLARQQDGLLPGFPIWDDVQTFDGCRWRGHIDVITGGFPCQDISAAGKGAGLAGARSGLWFAMLRVIKEVKPCWVLAENSPQLRTRGLGTVIAGLTRLGYDVRWCVLGAGDVGAPHLRKRMWVLAHADGPRELQQKRSIEIQRGWTGDSSQYVAYAPGERWNQGWESQSGTQKPHSYRQGGPANRAWPVEPNVGRVAYGVASRVDRLRAVGNGQVPRVAALAWDILSQEE